MPSKIDKQQSKSFTLKKSRQIETRHIVSITYKNFRKHVKKRKIVKRSWQHEGSKNGYSLSRKEEKTNRHS